MATSIWKTLKKPIVCLAPMAGVTDSAMRRVMTRLGKPDLCFTEFVSTAGLCSAGRDELMGDLDFHADEHPIIAQIFGCVPDQFERCAALVASLGFDGVDINMGCPDKKVQKQRSGAMLMQDLPLAIKIVEATKRGAGDLPVSVKTRIGYHEEDLEEILKHLLETEPAAISIHWRTKKQMYRGSARWELAPRAVDLVRSHGGDTLLIGNGDVRSLQQAYDIAEETGVDGVMIGRRIFSNPWVFNPEVTFESITHFQRIEALRAHLDFFDECFEDRKHFLMIRKYVRSYINGFRGAKELRIALQTAPSIESMRGILSDFEAEHEEKASTDGKNG
jgi:nifR3 family TIM-barrel protein